MSVDHWRTLNRLIGDPALQREPALPMTLVWLDRAITSLMTLSGFVLDGMTRGIGWRFVSIGRRVERLATMCSTLQVAIDEGRAHDLDWLLELADSSVTYRSRYLAAPEWLPVLDMVMRDEANPRSLAFQAKGLADFIARLEATHGAFAVDDRWRRRTRRCARCAPADLRPESEHLAEVDRRAAAGRLRDLRRDVAEVLLARRAAQHAAARGMSTRRLEPAPRRPRDRYSVEHETRYAYRVPVSQSWQLAHLTPLPAALAARRLRTSSRSSRAPDERHDARDAFGNGVTHFGVHGPHPLAARSHDAARSRSPIDPTPRARQRRWPGRRCASRSSTIPAQDGLRAARMAEPSTLVPWSDAAHAYAAPSFARRPRLARRRHRPDAPHPSRVRVRHRRRPP